MVASMKMAVSWVVAPCSVMMEAASPSETSVNFYQTTRHYNPEDSHLQLSVLTTSTKFKFWVHMQET
jgi:hypothetical protein